MTTPQFLFIYGSMLDEDVLKIVLGRPFAPGMRRAARLPDYACVRLPDESYPILEAEPGGEVHGAVLSGLTDEDWQRVEFFESAEYRFEMCRVVLDDGTQVDAVYCAADAVVPGACENWSLDWWRPRHKAQYLSNIRQYMALFGRAGLEEAEALWERLSERDSRPGAGAE